MLVEALGTWPVIVEIGEEEDRWMGGGWNIVEEELRRFLIIRTI